MLRPEDVLSTLNVSGRIIHVTTTIPSQIVGTETGWETHLVAWPGELINKQDGSRNTSDNTKEGSLYLSKDEKYVINRSENIHPVWLLDRDQDRWRQYAENCLWPVFHGVQTPDTSGNYETNWHDYVTFNESYFHEIKSIYRPGDIICIHSYYLMLLPQLLRMEFPNAYMGFLLHIPFPSIEHFKRLPECSQLLDGILGSDTIGFQSESFQSHFINCCSGILGYDIDDAKISVRERVVDTTLCIGIEGSQLEHEEFPPEVRTKINALPDIYRDKTFIVGIDQSNSVEGAIQELNAFEMLLKMFPEWRNKVVFVQLSSSSVSPPSDINILDALVDSINHTYGNLTFKPVFRYQLETTNVARPRNINVAVVSPVANGINITVAEYDGSQDHNMAMASRELAGPTAVLRGPVMVYPWDSVGIARTIHKCLLLAQIDQQLSQGQANGKTAIKSVKTWTTVQRRTNELIVALTNHLAHRHKVTRTPALNKAVLLEHYKQLHRRLFLFDYDGTLTPIVTDPETAVPSNRLVEIMDALAQDPKNQIWIISGRDQRFLSKWFGEKHVGLSAEHGCFMKDFDGDWVNFAQSFDMSWQTEVEDILQSFTDKTPKSNVEKKKVALVWHYRRAEPELGKSQAEKLMRVLQNTVAMKYDVEIMAGKANIEVRPKFVNKGEIVKRLVLHPHGTKQLQEPIIDHNYDIPSEQVPDFVLCLGDDLTDEDMFKSLNQIETNWNLKNYPKNPFGAYGIYTVVVGPPTKQTIATAHLEDPSHVIETLGLFTGHTSLLE